MLIHQQTGIMNLFDLLRPKPRNPVIREPHKAFIIRFIQRLLVGLITLAFGGLCFYAAMNFFEIVTAVSTFIDKVAYKLGLHMIQFALFPAMGFST